MEREQEQIIKEALNVGIEMCTREESEYAEENHELQHNLKTIDKAWEILFGEKNMFLKCHIKEASNETK